MSENQAVGEQGLLRRLGGTSLGVWVIKHIVSPLDRRLYRWTGGRRVALGRPLAPRLLLTTTGRHTGLERTVPVFYLRDGDRLVLNKYHETLTQFWVRIVSHLIDARPEIAAFERFLEVFPYLLDKELPSQHWRRETMQSQAAQAHWVEPDLLALPA